MAPSNIGFVNVCLVMFLVFGIHTAISLPFTPHRFFAFVATCCIFLVNARYITARLLVWFLLVLAAMTSVGLIISFSGGVPLGTELRAMTNFVYDIFTGLGVYFGLMRMGRDRTQKLFRGLLVFLVVGAVLEVIGIVKPLSDWFRETLLTQSVYDLNERDISMYGLIRPKFFASEPSMLGITISVSFYLWFSALRRRRRKDYAVALLLLAVALAFVRSPVIVFGPIAYLLTLSVTSPTRGRWTPRLRYLVLPLFALTSLFIPGILFALKSVPGAPAYLTSNSMFSREVAPYFMAVRSIQAHPLFGIGLQDDDQLRNLAIGVYTMPGEADRVLTDTLDSLGSNSCNAFWFTFISFGICGTGILALMVMRLLKILKVPVSFLAVSCIACFTYWMTFGRVNSPVAWFTYFAVAAACKLRMDDVSAQ